MATELDQCEKLFNREEKKNLRGFFTQIPLQVSLVEKKKTKKETGGKGFILTMQKRQL